MMVDMETNTVEFQQAMRELQYATADLANARVLAIVLQRAASLRWERQRQEQLQMQAAIKASFGGGQ